MSKIKANHSNKNSIDLHKARNESIKAQYILATLYYKEIEKNLEMAFYWFQKAAENDYKLAQNMLAILYENGEGTEKNLVRAFYWYQKAAENGYEIAMYNLASCYQYGKGTKKI